MKWDKSFLKTKFLGNIEKDIGPMCDFLEIVYGDLSAMQLGKHAKGWVVLTSCEKYFGFFKDKEECLKFLVCYVIYKSDEDYKKVSEAIDLLTSI